jgi:hypothetical protein
VSVVCCHVEVSATGPSLVQRSPIECGVSESDRELIEEVLAHWGLLRYGGEYMALYYCVTVIKQIIIFIKQYECRMIDHAS